jgi:hypothetical protein
LLGLASLFVADAGIHAAETVPGTIYAHSMLDMRSATLRPARIQLNGSTGAETGGPLSGLPNMTYGGGNVVTAPVIVPVFWGFNQPSAKYYYPSQDPYQEIPYALNFLSALPYSPWLATVQQYFQFGAAWYLPPVNLNPAILKVASPIFDTSSSPAASYRNSDVAAEAQRIAARIGTNPDEIIVIFTPHNKVNADLVTQSACAEHFGATGVLGLPSYTYVSMPYNPDQASCGSRSLGNTLDGVSIVLGHEIAETLTDPYGGSGWTASGQEIGDLCAWQNLMQTPGHGAMYATQPLWSNRARNCIQMTVAMRTPSGNFVTANNGGGLGGRGTPLQTDRQVASIWETFTLDWISSYAQTFSLKTNDGLQVTAVNGGGIGGAFDASAPMRSNATAIGVWEQFEIGGGGSNPYLTGTYTCGGQTVYPPNACVTIQTLTGNFVTAQNGGGLGGSYGIPFWTKQPWVEAWETFGLVEPYASPNFNPTVSPW